MNYPPICPGTEDAHLKPGFREDDDGHLCAFGQINCDLADRGDIDRRVMARYQYAAWHYRSKRWKEVERRLLNKIVGEGWGHIFMGNMAFGQVSICLINADAWREWEKP